MTIRDFSLEPARRKRVGQANLRNATPAHLVAFGADFDTPEYREPQQLTPEELIGVVRP